MSVRWKIVMMKCNGDEKSSGEMYWWWNVKCWIFWWWFDVWLNVIWWNVVWLNDEWWIVTRPLVMGSLQPLFPDTGLYMYADDITICVPITPSSNNLASEINNIRSWSSLVQLSLNEKKTQRMFITCSKNSAPTALNPTIELQTKYQDPRCLLLKQSQMGPSPLPHPKTMPLTFLCNQGLEESTWQIRTTVSTNCSFDHTSNIVLLSLSASTRKILVS